MALGEASGCSQPLGKAGNNCSKTWHEIETPKCLFQKFELYDVLVRSSRSDLSSKKGAREILGDSREMGRGRFCGCL
jgi:hypothetical protein